MKPVTQGLCMFAGLYQDSTQFSLIHKVSVRSLKIISSEQEKLDITKIVFFIPISCINLCNDMLCVSIVLKATLQSNRTQTLTFYLSVKKVAPVMNSKTWLTYFKKNVASGN